MDPSKTSRAGRPRLADEKHEAVLILSREGKTPKQIAAAVGISLAKVYEFLRWNEKGPIPTTDSTP